MRFWQRHFKNHNFTFAQDRFTSWKYWQEKVPFFTKEDFIKVGFEARLADAADLCKEGYCILRTTSGTTSMKEPVLLLHQVSLNKKNPEEYGKRTLWLHESFGACLLGALTNAARNKESGHDFDILILSPSELQKGARERVSAFRPDTVYSTPAIFARVVAELRDIPFKRMRLGGDFITKNQLEIIKSYFPEAKISHGYALAEIGARIARSCRFLRERHGFAAYHPRKSADFLLELIDIDDNRFGEIVVSKIRPKEFAMLRYKTGDMAKVVEESCECGEKYAFILAGRKNFDYIKCAGALVTRAELERVMGGSRDFVEDWRAEAGEKVVSGGLSGFIKLKIKPKPGFIESRDIQLLIHKISENLFLTPQETLTDLVQRGVFLPLEIELVSEFPSGKKELLIRKTDAA